MQSCGWLGLYHTDLGDTISLYPIGNELGHFPGMTGVQCLCRDVEGRWVCALGGGRSWSPAGCASSPGHHEPRGPRQITASSAFAPDNGCERSLCPAELMWEIKGGNGRRLWEQGPRLGAGEGAPSLLPLSLGSSLLTPSHSKLPLSSSQEH